MGFTPYDYLDRFLETHLGLWDEAIEAKFHGKGNKWNRKDFDRVTKDYDARYPSLLLTLRSITETRPVHSRCSMLFLRRRSA